MRARWRRRTLSFEAARSGLALVVTGTIALLQPLVSSWQFLLLPLMVLFASALANCLLRAVSEVCIDGAEIRVTRGWLPDRALKWTDLDSLEVRMFPLGRYSKVALADMKLRGGSTRILIDDGIQEFRDVLAHVWREASAHGIGVSDVTRANLVALGLDSAREP